MGQPLLARKQAQFLQSKGKTTIFRGGIGCGKTRVLCMRGMLSALNRRDFCLVSFSYPTLRDVCWPLMVEVCDACGVPCVPKVSDMIFQINGHPLLMRSGDKPDSLRGLNLHDFGIDEAREFKDRALFDIMIGRMRKSADGQAFIVTSAKGKNWTWELEQKEGSETVIMKTEENPFLPREYIEYLKAQYTPQFWRQEGEADIVEFGAGIISPEWFRRIAPYRPDDGVRFWDLAVTTSNYSDYSAGALTRFAGDDFHILDMVRGKWSFPELRARIIQTAIEDGPGVVIGLEEAGQQRGFIDDLTACPDLRPFTIRTFSPAKHGDKLNRAMPWASRAQLGRVFICLGKWNEAFLSECADFTADDSHRNDDQIDAVSGGYHLGQNASTLEVGSHYI